MIRVSYSKEHNRYNFVYDTPNGQGAWYLTERMMLDHDYVVDNLNKIFTLAFKEMFAKCVLSNG